MSNKESQYLPYLTKAISWIIGNAAFGLFPMLFLSSVYYWSDKELGGKELDDFIYTGSVLFLCMALTGSVLTDFYLSGIRLNGFKRLITYVIPFNILYNVTINYFLVCFGYIDKERLSLTSG